MEQRAASLNTVDTTSPAALAMAAAIVAENARAGKECRAKFKFTPRHCMKERAEPPPVGIYRDLWNRNLPLAHPEYFKPPSAPVSPLHNLPVPRGEWVCSDRSCDCRRIRGTGAARAMSGGRNPDAT